MCLSKLFKFFKHHKQHHRAELKQSPVGEPTSATRQVHNDVNQLRLQPEVGNAEQEAAVSKSRLTGSCCATYFCTSNDAPIHAQQSIQGIPRAQIPGPSLLCCRLPHLLHGLGCSMLKASDDENINSTPNFQIARGLSNILNHRARSRLSARGSSRI